MLDNFILLNLNCILPKTLSTSAMHVRNAACPENRKVCIYMSRCTYLIAVSAALVKACGDDHEGHGELVPPVGHGARLHAWVGGGGNGVYRVDSL